MTLPEQSVSAIERYVAAKPNGGYGDRRYNFQDHGLNEQEERDKFRPYLVRFGVTTETAAKRGSAGVKERVTSAGERTLQD
jgi:hypothetical protein